MGAALFFILSLAIIVIALFAPRNMGDINFCHRCSKGLKSPSKLCSECRPNKKNSTQKNSDQLEVVTSQKVLFVTHHHRLKNLEAF